MQRLKLLLIAWFFAITGPLVLVAMLAGFFVEGMGNEDESPWTGILIGAVMTTFGVVALRSLRRSKGGASQPVAGLTRGGRTAAAAGSGDRGGRSAEISWTSNAPSHWPIVRTPRDVVEGPHPLLLTRFSAQLKRAFGNQPGAPRLAALLPTHLLAEGVLRAHLTVEDRDCQRPVFVYAAADEEAATHFAGARQALAERAVEPVYFAPAKLPEAAPTSVLEPVTPSHFQTLEGTPPAGHYAMWWPSEGDGVWRTSGCRADIGRVYEALDGYQTYAAGILLHQLGVVEQEGRVALPVDLMVYPVKGPENQILVLSLSAEKGVRLHFGEDTPATVRDRVWKHFASFCERFRPMLSERGAPQDADSSGRPLDWWQRLADALDAMEQRGEPVQKVGVVPIENTR